MNAEENASKLRRCDWRVADVPLAEAHRLVAAHHYSGGGSNTRTYAHGLVERSTGRICGVAWWIPPTKGAAITVNPEWEKVLTLSRLVIEPGIPKNAATYLLAASVRLIQADRRFISLVTYADEGRGHTGGIYRAAGWAYVGKTKPEPQFVDSVTGRYVARKAGPVTRTREQMEALGYSLAGRWAKHKFVKHLRIQKAGCAGVFA